MREISGIAVYPHLTRERTRERNLNLDRGQKNRDWSGFPKRQFGSKASHYFVVEFLKIIIPAAPAAAAFPPEDPFESCAPVKLYVLELNPEVAEGEVDVGGSSDGTLPG